MNDNAVAESTSVGPHSRGLGDSGDHPEACLRAEGDIGHVTEDPPRNSQGKLICRYQNICPELVFDRKREWR
jgi:hypothetical protein